MFYETRMHLRRVANWAAICTLMLFGVMGCNRDGTEAVITEPDPGTALQTLLVAKTVAAPQVDGTIAAGEWDTATPIYVTTVVPAIEAFKGDGGRGYTVRLRAMYDNDNVYFLAEWDDPTKSLDREPWYFDTLDSQWKFESPRPTIDADGKLELPAFYEDKFSFMFQARVVSGFATQGCAVACHTNLDPFSNDGGKTALKYTNNGGEVLDMWHWKSVRGTEAQTCDDQQTTWQRASRSGGRRSDPGTGAYSNNRQTLSGQSVPKYVIPGASVRYYWVTTDGTAPIAQNAGLAKLVTGLAPDGTLTLSDATTINPTVDADFHRGGSQMPSSVFVRPPSGDRADITAVGNYSSGWALELKRARVTGGANETDVQFNDLDRVYPFGVAVFDNAQIAHAISGPPLNLKFVR